MCSRLSCVGAGILELTLQVLQHAHPVKLLCISACCRASTAITHCFLNGSPDHSIPCTDTAQVISP